MNISNSEIRAKAREALGKNILSKTWLIAMAIGFIISSVLTAANAISSGIATLFLSGPLYVGLNMAYLHIARGDREVTIGTAFEGCYDFKSNLILGIMHNLIIWLWSLLFIIPGIIKGYSYSMAYYIKADHPEYGWRECLEESEKMMKGYKLRYFLLNFSFIGWILLSIVTFGIASFWVNTYMSTASAVFYDELKREKCIF